MTSLPLQVVFRVLSNLRCGRTRSIYLSEHNLTMQLQNCDTVESMAALLQDQLGISAFDEFREKGSHGTLSILTKLSANVSESLGDAVGLVRQKPLMTFSPFLMFFF